VSDRAFHDVVIVGGGCYGTFYATQLLAARDRGRATWKRLQVVDRDPGCRFVREVSAAESVEFVAADWGAFFDDYLGRAASCEPRPAAPSAIVPSPLMPHLMYQWLVRRAQSRWPGREIVTRPLPVGPGTPYDVAAPDGTRFVSFADWLCPTHCIEPALCPVTRAPRTWEMADALEALVRRLGRDAPVAGPVVFACEHQVFGVGTIAVAEVLDGDRLLAEAGRAGGEIAVVVGTVSSCHGAVNLLQLGRG
jgi:hypothetical protein